MPTAAEKKKLYRAGWRTLPVSVHLVTWSEILIDAGFLAEWDGENLAAVAEATRRYIEAANPAMLDVS